MQEAIAARLEDLRAVGAAIMAGDIPGLSLEEFGIRAKHRPEILQSAGMQYPQRGLEVSGVNLRRSLGRGREFRIGPHRVIVMIARHDRERRLAGDQAEAFMRLRHLYRFHLFGRCEMRIHDRVRHSLEAARGVLRVHGLGLVLPHIAER